MTLRCTISTLSFSDAFSIVSVLVSESKHWSLMYNFPGAEKEREQRTSDVPAVPSRSSVWAVLITRQVT